MKKEPNVFETLHSEYGFIKINPRKVMDKVAILGWIPLAILVGRQCPTVEIAAFSSTVLASCGILASSIVHSQR